MRKLGLQASVSLKGAASSARSHDFHELRDHVTQHAFGKGAYLPVHDFAGRDEEHGWNALHSEFACPFRIFVCVYFRHDKLAGIFLRQLLERGCNHPAWPAPWGPKVDDYRQRRLKNALFERQICYVNWFIKHAYIISSRAPARGRSRGALDAAHIQRKRELPTLPMRPQYIMKPT
jgi:hypothetical protein